jgi:hypothetical protein
VSNRYGSDEEPLQKRGSKTVDRGARDGVREELYGKGKRGRGGERERERERKNVNTDLGTQTDLIRENREVG